MPQCESTCDISLVFTKFTDTSISKDGMHSQNHEVPARGQVLIVVSGPPTLGSHQKRVCDALIELLEVHGRLFALVKRATFSDGTIHAVAEFCSTTAARNALHIYHDGVSTIVSSVSLRS